MEPAEYGLELPFVACESAGGPYDDAAFVAGFECGFVESMLHVVSRAGGSFERWVNPALMPQLDLIAMKHGYKTTSEPWDEHPDEYVKVNFEPSR